MKLENLRIAIRPRRDWEAIDLGILMARHWWLPMVKVWMVVSAPLLLPILFLKNDQIELYAMFIWLIKPLLERPLLMILSQGVFGTTPDLRTVLKACPRLMTRQWLVSLTWRRLSPTRSMDLAVQQLEGLKGAERSARLAILHRQGTTPATWLTIIGVHLETFLAIAIISSIALFIPENVNFELIGYDLTLNERFLSLAALTYLVSMGLVAPFYVACGFSLYLNRRVKLEGWDLEIAFKRMLQRRNLTSIIPIALGVLIFCGATLPQTALAQDAPTESQLSADRGQTNKALREILADEPFRVIHENRVLKRKAQKPVDAGEDTADLSGVLEVIANAVRVLSRLLEWALWTAVFVLVVYVALRYKRWQRFFAERWPSAKHQPYRPETLFGLQVTEESLPDDIGAAALGLWRNGEERAALALLYRASLSSLLNNGVPLGDGSTEGECLQIVKAHAERDAVTSSAIGYFHELTGYWQKLAYGHVQPPEDRVIQLCQSWNACWLEQQRHGS